MPTTERVRTLTVSFNDDGSVRAIKGDIWRITTDEQGTVIDQKHIGTKTTFTAAELSDVLPNADLTTHVAMLTAERDVLAAQVEPLKEQIRTLKGVPRFQAADLLKQITDAEKEHITQFVANNDQLRPLWAAFLGRIVGAPIPLDSQTFLAALHGLRQALGEQRVSEMFTALNINLDEGSYIDPTRA